jgi:hypothetical protein
VRGRAVVPAADEDARIGRQEAALAHRAVGRLRSAQRHLLQSSAARSACTAGVLEGMGRQGQGPSKHGA